MPRSVPEWIGKNDDQQPPPNVKLRIYERHGGRCANCGNKVLPAYYDHIVPLGDRGGNRESNIQLLCGPCHGAKTATEASVRADVRTVAKKHIGLHQPKGRPLPGTKRSGWRKKMNGEVVRR